MKTPIPNTRNSLSLRLSDACDAEAWDQFASIYEPLVYRLARAKGFQDADAREIVQEVLVVRLRFKPS
jgi:RNA polymerase sigma-70 factor (ECF subfamily)